MKQWNHAIISGGGSGIGLGLACRLLKRGDNVSIIDLAVPDAARAELESAAEQGGSAWVFHRADLTVEEQVFEAVGKCVEAFGAPGLGVNSAGILINKTFRDTRADEFRKVIDINLVGSYHFARAMMPYLSRGGRLALIASMAGLTSSYGYTAYGTSKFGVVGLATTLRYEYDPLGIGITCVCPPEVKTPMVSQERSPGNADPVSLAIKDIAGSLDADYACDAILNGIDAGDWLVVPGFKSKATMLLARHTPALFNRFMDFNIRRFMRRFGQLQPA